MTWKIILLTVFFAARLCSAGAPTTQPSRENHFHVQLPDGWKAHTEGMEAHDLYLVGPSRAFLFCNSEAKEDFAEPENALAQSAERKAAEISHWMTEATVSEHQPLVINGLNAIRFEAHGQANGMKMIHVITIIETPSRVITWTGVSSPSRIEQHRPMFEQIIASIREGPAPATQPASGK